MFYYINGNLVLLNQNTAVIDAGGIGYKLTISSTTHDLLSNAYSDNAAVKLFTHMAVREDDVELFGFYSNEELSTFKLLTSVSGIGPKVAIAILSIFTPEKFALAVCSDDTKAIAKASGVGTKTAARIILELQDKMIKNFPTTLSTTVPVSSTLSSETAKNILSEARDALTVLGYTRSEITNALQGLNGQSDVEEVIKQALKKLMK